MFIHVKPLLLSFLFIYLFQNGWVKQRVPTDNKHVILAATVIALCLLTLLNLNICNFTQSSKENYLNPKRKPTN